MLHSLTATQVCLPQSVDLSQMVMLQQACTSWSQQPASPAAVKLEPGKPEAAAAAAACAARPAAAAATDGLKTADEVASETPSPPHASAADAPPVLGEQCNADTGLGFRADTVMMVVGIHTNPLWLEGNTRIKTHDARASS